MIKDGRMARIVGGYLIVAVALVFVVHLFEDGQRQINDQAIRARDLAKESARQAAIVAQNQKLGTDFFLKECVSNRILLQVQAEDKAAASAADRATAQQFAAYGERDMAKLVKQRADRELKTSQMFRELMPIRCGFPFRDSKTGVTKKVGS